MCNPTPHKMTMRAGCMLLALTLAACASEGALQFREVQPAVYPPDVFAHRVASAHVLLYWNCTRPEQNLLRLDGVAHNEWSSQEIKFLEFDLVGMDSHDRIVSEAKAEARDMLLFTNQMTPFQLELRTAGTEVRFDLFYQYRYHEGDHGRWIAGPFPGGPILLAQTQSFMARDVCSDSKHRVR